MRAVNRGESVMLGIVGIVFSPAIQDLAPIPDDARRLATDPVWAY